MDRPEALARLSEARSGHLATVRPDGKPHIVVITFATLDGKIVTAIDHKPKTTNRLQRLVNIESSPRASFLVDHYDEDWSRLWWVRVDGDAEIWERGDLWNAAVASLSAKYPQYREHRPDGPVIAISQDQVNSWESTP